MSNSRKSFARAIWNGPFHIAPLSSPVSLGDALLKLLETLWRGVVLLALLVLFAATIVFGATIWDQHLRAVISPPLESMVSAEVEYFGSSNPVEDHFFRNPDETLSLIFPCTNDAYPLSVTFTNNSDLPVGKITFTIGGTYPGRSSNVLPLSPVLEADKIILPGWSWQTCYTLPVQEGVDQSSLVYAVEIIEAQEADPAQVEAMPPPITFEIPPAPSPDAGGGEN